MSNCRKVGLIACSNALPAEKHGQIKKLENFLRECGLTPIRSRCIFERDGSPFSGTGKERAEELNGRADRMIAEGRGKKERIYSQVLQSVK